MKNSNYLLDLLPAEAKLPLLAMMSWSVLSVLTILLTLEAPISVRSMAMSPKFLDVVILDFI